VRSVSIQLIMQLMRMNFTCFLARGAVSLLYFPGDRHTHKS
jgi:hypothetical protein